MPNTVKLADYLFTRLKQLGVGAVHGVPGDYNLTLLDYVEPNDLQWVGNANELNAGYAADGYARIKGLGVLITTYGVGELSAINAIACSFTERAAVVHIVGTPPRDSQDGRLMIHHTLGDGEYRHFGQMASHVVTAQTDLIDPQTCPEQIDSILKRCIIQSRPIYIEVPTDMVAVQVAADRLDSQLKIFEALPDPAIDAALDAMLEKIYAAKQPMILVDGETRSLGIVDSVQKLIDSTKWPTFVTAFSKGLINETSPSFFGIHRGGTADKKTKAFVDSSDLVLFFGPQLTATNSYSYSSIPKKDITISFTHTGIRVGDKLHRATPVRHTVSQLLQRLDTSKAKTYDTAPDLARDHNIQFSSVPTSESIRQDKVWRLLGNFLQPGDIIFGETGTPAYGSRDMPLPPHCRMTLPATWLSIGYMLPASQGAALAQRELIAASQYHDLKSARTILLIGDGSFQMTAQELSTIVRLDLDVVIFLINNDGYTIERCIHGLNQKYNDIGRWRYLKAPELFGAKEDTYTAQARTYGELQKILSNEQLTSGKGLRMVEIFMDKNDAPVGPLLDMINKQKAIEKEKEGNS